MEPNLQGQVAIVTGSGRGIGRGEALALASHGAAVVVNFASNSTEALKTVDLIKAKGVEAIPIRADVSQGAQVRAMVQAALERFGRIDILVNNAGIASPHVGRTVVDTSEESWDAMIAVHLRGTYLCIKYVAPHMMKQKSGRIINTASVHGQVGGRPGMGSYGAAKAGVMALTKTCARELAPHGILVNALSLGYVDTEMLAGIPEALREDLSQRQIPLGRMARPEEIGEWVVWLASPSCTYATGSIIEVNGGRLEYLGPPVS